jgi:hypothetical protein
MSEIVIDHSGGPFHMRVYVNREDDGERYAINVDTLSGFSRGYAMRNLAPAAMHNAFVGAIFRQLPDVLDGHGIDKVDYVNCEYQRLLAWLASPDHARA